jgi:hypothetical protein
LARDGPLRAGLTPEAAADTIWALASPEVHHLLTVDAGWSQERFAEWLADSLIATLLPPELDVWWQPRDARRCGPRCLGS